MDTYWQKERDAAGRVQAILARPMPSDEQSLGVEGDFDPWDVFPALYGGYSSDFDCCAIQVLEDLRDKTWTRHDLAAEMLREMLCTAGLCDYGSSPRVCFPTPEFKALLPDLIEKWRAYSLVAWGEDEAALPQQHDGAADRRHGDQ